MHMQAPPAISSTPIPNIMDEENVSAAPVQPAPPPVLTAPPPRPMNPQLAALHAALHVKFTAELSKFTASLAKDSEGPRAAQNDLLAGEPTIKDEMARLESVKSVCKTVAGRLGAVVNAAESAIGELKRKGDPEVDELVCATNIVHNQYVLLSKTRTNC
jgi:ESCRT-I complex subunit TSG101